MNKKVFIFISLLIASITTQVEAQISSFQYGGPGSLPGIPLNGQPGQTRQKLGIGPNRANIKDFGGYADAWRGAVYYAANSTSIALSAWRTYNTTVDINSQTSITLYPHNLAPTISAFGANPMYINTSNGGTSGASTHCTVGASNPTTGVITVSSCSTMVVQTGLSTVVNIYTSSPNPKNGGDLVGDVYGTIAFGTATSSSNTIGTTVTIPNSSTFPGSTTIPGYIDGAKLCVIASGYSEWCGIIVQDTNTVSNVVSVVGQAPYPAVFPGTGSSLAARVTWGQFLFRPDDAAVGNVPARNIEIPLAGNSTTVNPMSGQTDAFETTIASVISPIEATLASSVLTEVPPSPVSNGANLAVGMLITGHDDYPAYIVAVQSRAFQQPTLQEDDEVYFPSDSFMASAVANNINMSYVSQAEQCGEGTVFWPSQGQLFYHGAAQCGDKRQIKTFPTALDMIPAVTLKHLASLSAGSTATLDLVGNSPTVPGEQGAGFISSRLESLCTMFERAYPDLKWMCNDRSVGGMRWDHIDPNGFTNGRPAGVWTASNLPSAFYTTPSNTWMSYIEADDPDIVVFAFADQEGQAINMGAMIDTVGYTQTTSWNSTTGHNPDIGLWPFNWQPTGSYSETGTEFAASVMRSWVKACKSGNTVMAGGGCPFLIDSAREQTILWNGYDPETAPMRRTILDPCIGGQEPVCVNFPYVHPFPRTGMTTLTNLNYTNASVTGPATLFSVIGGEVDQTVGALSADNKYNCGSCNYAFVGTYAVATANSGQPTIEVGYGAYQMSVGMIISGSGIAASSYINSISLSGATSTITLNNNLTANVTSGITLTFTPQAPSIVYPNGDLFHIYLDSGTGNIAYRYDTFFTQTTGSDCSWTNGNTFFTCTTPEVGYYHVGMQVSLPGAGSAQCPQSQSTSTNCLNGTVTSLAYNGSLNETVNFSSGSYAGTSVSNVSPAVYRISVPYTVSSMNAANAIGAGSLCTTSVGSTVRTVYMTEYRGSRLSLSYCYVLNPGTIVFDDFVERADAPFSFTMDSPNHMDSNVVVMDPLYSHFGLLAANGAVNTPSLGAWYEVDPEYPTVQQHIRLTPDVYSWCGPPSYGDQINMYGWSGQCGAHQGNMGMEQIDGPIFSTLRPR